jgi:hypothetical protein
MSLKKYLTEAELAAVQPITGDAFDISIRELTNIETVVVEHTEGSITIQLDDTAIKMLEECGCTFEDEQLDELAPVIGALARGVAAGAGALARGAAKAAVGTGVKAAADKLDKKLFGPRPSEGDYEYEESVREQDEDEEDYSPQVGDIVQVVYETEHEGHYGEVVELAPSGEWAYVQFKDGDIEAYHGSDLRQATEQEEEEYYYGSEDEFEESLNSIRKLSGMAPKEAVKEESYDKSSGSPYDRGAADSYYGRKARPHKMVPASDGVKGQMQMVSLTDPKEIAAYNAGYSENDDRKNYGEGIEDWNMKVTSIPRTEPFQLKKIVVKSKFGKTYTFDTEEDARRHFGSNWDSKINNPEWRAANGWKLEMNNTKPVDEAEYRGRKVSLGKPMQGDVAKFKVYVKDPKTGNVKKVNFGDKTMRIKKSNPKRRKSFRARHRCKNPGPRTKARYWSCRAW